MKKMLIAIDDSQSAMKAVEYAGQQFSGIGDLQIVLFHVLPNLPAIFWDEGISSQNRRRRTERSSWTNGWPTGRQKWSPCSAMLSRYWPVRG